MSSALDLSTPLRREGERNWRECRKQLLSGSCSSMFSALDLRSRRTSEISTPDGSWFFLCPPEYFHTMSFSLHGGVGGDCYIICREREL